VRKNLRKGGGEDRRPSFEAVDQKQGKAWEDAALSTESSAPQGKQIPKKKGGGNTGKRDHPRKKGKFKKRLELLRKKSKNKGKIVVDFSGLATYKRREKSVGASYRTARATKT